MEVVRIENVNKYYNLGNQQVRALSNINLAVEEGDLLAIAGPSGSGKSTLLNIIGCIDSPSSGQISIAGKPVSGQTPDQLADLRATTIGFIFQTFNLLPVLSAEENVEYPLLQRKDVTKATNGANGCGISQYRWPGKVCSSPPQSVKRRSAPKSSDRPRTGDSTKDRSGGRAYRQPGPENRRVDSRADEAGKSNSKNDLHFLDPRSGGHAHGAQSGSYSRRGNRQRGSGKHVRKMITTDFFPRLGRQLTK